MMYKYIITAILIALFAGCSAPKPKHAPAWFTSVPKDTTYIYAVGSAKTLSHAKNKAIASLRQKMKNEMDSPFVTRSTTFNLDNGFNVKDVLEENEHFVNTISLANVKTEITDTFNTNHLILLKLSRKEIFDKLNIIATQRLNQSRKNYQRVQKDPLWIKKFSLLHNEMKSFAKVVSTVSSKKAILNAHNNTKEIIFLNTLRQEYLDLKNEISFYVLSDVNSRIFVQSIKEAVGATGLTLSSKAKSEKSLKLIVTSKTENIQDYGFKKSKSLVQYSTYDLSKKKIAFRQHTFAAKSRRGYSDAKAQSALYEKGLVKKLGIFDFLGI